MTREDLIIQIQLVINLLELEINKRDRKKGVYKELYRKYIQAKQSLINGEDYNNVRIIGSVRYFVDSSQEENYVLISEMGKAEDVLKSLSK